MRLISCALAALALMPHSDPAQAQKKPAKPEQAPWVTSVATYRLDEKAADPSTSDLARVESSWLERWQWITPDDLPPEYRGRPLHNRSLVLVDVDTAGKPTACRVLSASAEPRLDALACELLMKRSSFAVRYVGPAQPVAYPFPASVLWRNTAAAEIKPTPPPMFTSRAAPTGPWPRPPSVSLASYAAWPRLNWSDRRVWENELVFGPAPAIQAAWPGGAQGTVSLDLVLSPEKGAADCRIGLSSGSGALDEAACRVARTVPVRYQRPCERCQQRTLPLQIVWKKKGSFVRFPLQPDSPAYVGSRRPISGTFAAADFAKLPDRSVTERRVWANVWVDEDGKPIKCRVQSTTGNRAVDARLCELVVKRWRYSKRTDVFGRPAGDIHITHLDLVGLL